MSANTNDYEKRCRNPHQWFIKQVCGVAVLFPFVNNLETIAALAQTNDGYTYKIKTARYALFLLLLLIPLPNYMLQAQTYPVYKAKSKKLVTNSASQDDMSVPYIRDNIARMEAQNPHFNGMTFQLKRLRILDNVKWTDAEMEFEALRSIGWNKFTDNFINIHFMSKANDPEWFNEDWWATVLHNTTQVSKAVKAAKCKGIMLDTEFYYHNETYSPWYYDYQGRKYYPGKTFAEMEAIVRQRGAEFMNALESANPGVIVIPLTGISSPWAQSGQNINNLPTTQFALYPAFVDGMYGAADPATIIADGNEGTYYMDESKKFTENFAYLNQAAANLFKVNFNKWKTNGQVAEAVYVENVNGWYPNGPAGRIWEDAYYRKWTEHNVYHALLNTSEYVWIYSEVGDGGTSYSDWMDWYSNPPKHLPTGIQEDIQNARTKLKEGRALGFEMVKPAGGYWDGKTKAQFITSPTVSIASPANNAILSSGEVTINANVSSAAQKVEFYVNSWLVGTDNSAPYNFAISLPTGKDYTLFARVHLADGNHNTSNPVTVSTAGVSLRSPENPVNVVNGLAYSYYEGSWSALPDFTTLTATKNGEVASFDLSSRNRNDNFGFAYTGYVTVPSDGQYTFYTSSDDGSQLFIGEQLIVNNDGLHSLRERSGTIGLKAGTHVLSVRYFERGGGETLTVSYSGSGLSKQVIPAASLWRVSGSSFSEVYMLERAPQR